jgi:hypothetical protein
MWPNRSLLVIGTLLGLGCDGPAPETLTLNNEFLLRQGGEADVLMGGCGTLSRNEARPARTASDLNFQTVASRAPDLEVAEAFDGTQLTVGARIKDSATSETRQYDFAFLTSGREDTLVVKRFDGSVYELRYWGGDCHLSER